MQRLEPLKPSRPDELDVWWGAFAGRTMLPGVLFCAVLTAASFAFLHRFGRWMPYVPSGILWLTFGTLWLYRITFWTYRLTTRRLFVSRGFHRRGLRAVNLTAVVQTSVERRGLPRWLAVGTLRVVLDDGSPPLVLEGVRQPDDLAVLIRQQILHVKEGEAASQVAE